MTTKCTHHACNASGRLYIHTHTDFALIGPHTMDEGIIQKLLDGYELDFYFFSYHVHVRAYFLF